MWYNITGEEIMNQIKKLMGLSVLITLADQIIKLLVVNYIKLNEFIEVIPNFFNLAYVQNKGAAWSILWGNQLILILIAILFSIIFYYSFIHKQKLSRMEGITYGVFYGGLFGNLIDRIIHGYVIDYLDFYLFKYDFPIFNLADIALCLSVGMIIILTLRGEKNENNK